MELWDLYNEERQKLPLTMRRGDPIPDGTYRLTVHVCLFNEKGEMLIQRRTDTKDVWPGLWDISAAGSALAGEDAADAAKRELAEELGITRSFKGIRPHLSVSWVRGFDDFFVLREDLPADAFTLQKEEVAEVRWASRAEVLNLLKDGLFVPYYENFLALLFDFSSGSYGCGAKL